MQLRMLLLNAANFELSPERTLDTSVQVIV
jgi:hypothetical protein